MRSVFRGMRRGAALAVVVVLLTAGDAAASPREKEQKDRLVDRIVVWLQGRVSIPPGNS